MTVLSQAIASFRRSHPYVQFSIYSATADDTKERMERGLLDLGLFDGACGHQPLRVFAHAPAGALGRPGARGFAPCGAKLRYPRRAFPPAAHHGAAGVRADGAAGWFGLPAEHLEVAATYNLVLNAVSMVRCGVGVALCYVLDDGYAGCAPCRLSPTLESGAVLAYKKGQALSRPSRASLPHKAMPFEHFS